MKSEWREYKLGDIASMKYGKMLSNKNSLGKYPVFSGYRVVGWTDSYNCKSDTPIVVARGVGGTGDVKILKTDCFLTNLSIMVDIDRSVCHPYFFYYKYLLNNLKWLDTGSAQSQITIDDLRRLSINLPPLPIQRKIASILSALDDKIETNNAICRNLEEQAMAIFSQHYQREDKTRMFTSVIQISGGGTPKTNEPLFWNGNIPFFTPKDAASPFGFTTEKTLTEEGLKNCNSILYPEWTTFITARGTVGKITMAGYAMAMNQSCYALVSEELHPVLVYLYASETVKSLKQKANGAVFDAIVTRDFDREEIKLIKQEQQHMLLKQIVPMYEKIRNIKLENLNICNIRDALLPKLMSGI